MSIQTKLKCDRCGTTSAADSIMAPDSLISPVAGWVVVDIRGLSPQGSPVAALGLHICPTCNPAIAELVPKATEAELARVSSMRQFPDRAGLKFTSGDIRVPTNRIVEIENRPGVDFMGDKIEVTSAVDWLIEDLVIGHRSQFAQAGAVPADTFTAPDMLPLGMEICAKDQRIRILATYIGKNPEGARFECTIFGRVGKGAIITNGNAELCAAKLTERTTFLRSAVVVNTPRTDTMGNEQK